MGLVTLLALISVLQSPADLFLLHYIFSIELQKKEHWNWVSVPPQLMLSEETHAIYFLVGSAH